MRTFSKHTAIIIPFTLKALMSSFIQGNLAFLFFFTRPVQKYYNNISIIIIIVIKSPASSAFSSFYSGQATFFCRRENGDEYQDKMPLFPYRLLAGGGGGSLSGQSLLLCSREPQMWHPTATPGLINQEKLRIILYWIFDSILGSTSVLWEVALLASGAVYTT